MAAFLKILTCVDKAKHKWKVVIETRANQKSR